MNIKLQYNKRQVETMHYYYLCKCTNVIFHLWNISQVENKSTPKCKSMKTEAYKTLRNKKFENNKRGDKFLGEKLTHTYKHNTLFLRNAEYPS